MNDIVIKAERKMFDSVEIILGLWREIDSVVGQFISINIDRLECSSNFSTS